MIYFFEALLGSMNAVLVIMLIKFIADVVRSKAKRSSAQAEEPFSDTLKRVESWLSDEDHKWLIEHGATWMSPRPKYLSAEWFTARDTLHFTPDDIKNMPMCQYEQLRPQLLKLIAVAKMPDNSTRKGESSGTTGKH